MGVRRILTAVLVVAAVLPATAGAAGPTSCRSGGTWIEHPGVRIFEVAILDRAAGFKIDHLYGCSAKVRRPRLVTQLSPATTPEIDELARVGSRILLDVYEFADGGGGSEIVWWDTRTGRRASRSLDNIGNTDFGQPILGGTIARDGSVAYVRSTLEEGEFEDEGAPPEQHALFLLRHRRGRFEKEKRLLTLPPAELDPRTVAFSGDTITWRTRGAERSLAIPPPPTPGSAPTPLRPRRSFPGNCRQEPGEGVFSEFLTDSLLVRLFKVTKGRRRGVWACRQGTKTKGRYVMPATRRLSVTATTARVVAFATRPRGDDGGIVGWFEPEVPPSLEVRTATLATEPYGSRKVVALAPGWGYGLAVLSAAPTGHVLSFLRLFGSGFEPEAQLALLGPGEIEPHTLGAAKGVVTWRTRGTLHSVPLS